MIGCLLVLFVVIVVIMIVWYLNDIILNLVGNVWVGFGVVFSFLVFYFLYWKDLICVGVISGMVVGVVVVIVWIFWIKFLVIINVFFGMYEIILGFIISVLIIYIVSKLIKKFDDYVIENFNKVKYIVKE